LGPDTAAVFDYRYGVEPNGNVPAEQDFQGEFKKKNILFERHSLAETAQHFGKPEAAIRATLDAARHKLFAARARRPRPPLDDKVLTAWNGLMISAFARAGQVLDDANYVNAAQTAAQFVQSKLYSTKTGKLTRRYRAGEIAVEGFLDDYAFFIQGLLDLYEASFDVRWLSWAIQLQGMQDQLFWDSKNGGYYSVNVPTAFLDRNSLDAPFLPHDSSSLAACSAALNLSPIKSWSAGISRLYLTQGTQPGETAALRLLFGLLASGQIKLRRIKGFRELEEKHEEAA